MLRLRLSVLIGVLCVPALGRANDDELARAHFITGQSYYSQNRYQDALNEFNEAYRLSHRPRFLYNIGVCYERLGQNEPAIANYEQYLAEEPEAEDRANALERIRALKQLEQEKKRHESPPAVAAPAPSPLISAPPPPLPPKPAYKRAWFWGVVAGSAALVAAGVAAGVVLGSPHDNTRTLADLRPAP